MKAEHTEKLSEPRNPAAARKAVQDFLKVNYNQKGGGGMALYHSHLGKLRKALKNVASPRQIEAEALLETMASKDNFPGKTLGTWRLFLPKVSKILDASKDEVQEAREAANPWGLDMKPVYMATTRAKRLRISCGGC